MIRSKTFWILAVLCVCSFAILIKGCDDDDDNPAVPAASHELSLKFVEPEGVAEKAIGLRIDILGLDERNVPTGPTYDPIIVDQPKFPLLINLTLLRPPCRYRFTVATTFLRDPGLTWEAVVNIRLLSKLIPLNAVGWGVS